jgi:hypothetical protein
MDLIYDSLLEQLLRCLLKIDIYKSFYGKKRILDFFIGVFAG